MDRGLYVDGVHYEVDRIIFATGFEVGTAYTRRAGYEVIGRDGVEAPSQYYPRAAHAARPDEPRLPKLLPHGRQPEHPDPNPHLLAEQAHHIAHIVSEANLRQAAPPSSSTAEAEVAWM